MDVIDELRKALDIRMHSDPDTYYHVSLWEHMVTIICTHLEETQHFLTNVCTDEELYWLGEIFDDIMEQTRSESFLTCLNQRAQLVIDQQWKQEILSDIQTASSYVSNPSSLLLAP